MFCIKICGVTTAEDAQAAVECGADAVGLNFYPPSPRFLARPAAAAVAGALEEYVAAGRCHRVGLFVDPPADVLRSTLEAVPLEWLQLHGDETPEQLAEIAAAFPKLRIIKAFRCGPAGLEPCRTFLHRCRQIGTLPQMVLLDGYRAGQYGGTGTQADWDLAVQYQAENGPPLILAGGLHPENVAQAIGAVRPAAVDTASGVESSPGVKDAGKVQAFVAAALAAWENPAHQAMG